LTAGATAGAIVWLLALGVPRDARAEASFLRGDANEDGKVTLSDSHFIFSYLFQWGAEPVCQDAGDADDDGRISITDGIVILNHLVIGGPAPCDPYPQLGEDEADDSLVCQDYGGGEPLEDPQAKIELLDAVASDDGRVTITVLLSSSVDLAGYSGRASFEGEVLANRQMSNVNDLTGVRDTGFVAAAVNGGKLHFGFISSFVERIALPPGQDVAVLEMPLCLNQGTAPGDYALTLEAGELTDLSSGRAIVPALAGATITVPAGLDPEAGCVSREDRSPGRACDGRYGGEDCGERDPLPTEPHLDFRRGDANVDGKVSVSDSLTIRRFLFNCGEPPPCLDAADANDDDHINLTDMIVILNSAFLEGAPPPPPFPEIGPDPTTDSLSCAAYDIVEPLETEDLIEIGVVEGMPGQLVEIPVYLTNTVEIEAFQLVVDHGGALVPEAEGSGYGLSFQDTYYSAWGSDDPPPDFRLAAPGPAGGFLTVCFVPNLIELGDETPPGTRQHVFNIVARVSPDAEPGAEVLLDPTAASSGEGVGEYGLRNEVTFEGTARYVGAIPRTLPGLLKIVPDITIFRGDANDDGEVELSDAVYTLDFLFIGGPAPRCPDAADANDDGTLNIADPVTVLQALFTGGATIAPPYPEIGEDPTPDALPPCAR
jgi:hypothetical protein